MKRQEFMSTLLRGAIAGLMSGFIFAIAMLVSGSATGEAAIGSTSTAVVGIVVTLVLAAVGGAGFAALMRSQPSGRGEMLFWGLSYGALLWFALPLTLVPLLMDGRLHWDVHSAQAAFPSLLDTWSTEQSLDWHSPRSGGRRLQQECT